MPTSISITDEQYVVVCIEGEVRPEDLQAVNEKLYSSMTSEVTRRQIIDLTGVSGVEVSSRDLERIAAQDKEAASSLGKVLIAVVAPEDLGFGMARMWEVFAESDGVESRVFRDVASARSWILSRIADEARGVEGV